MIDETSMALAKAWLQINTLNNGLREALDFWDPRDDMERQIWIRLADLCEYDDVRDEKIADAEQTLQEDS